MKNLMLIIPLKVAAGQTLETDICVYGGTAINPATIRMIFYPRMGMYLNSSGSRPGAIQMSVPRTGRNPMRQLAGGGISLNYAQLFPNNGS